MKNIIRLGLELGLEHLTILVNIFSARCIDILGVHIQSA